MSHSPREILESLAESLDIDGILERYPGTSREDIRKLILEAAALMPSRKGFALLWVDGASRGNPGQAGAGIFLDIGGKGLFRLGEYLGEATNNEAEYKALIMGMELARHQSCEELEIFSDSQLMVRQMRGEYRVKSPGLQDLYFQAVKVLASFKKVVFNHVPREQNREADRLANMAIDTKGKVSL